MNGIAAATETAVLVVLYDLREPGAWDEALRHARWWGRRYADLYHLDDDHVVLVFRPAPDERWRAWERVRARWIMRELGDLA